MNKTPYGQNDVSADQPVDLPLDSSADAVEGAAEELPEHRRLGGGEDGDSADAELAGAGASGASSAADEPADTELAGTLGDVESVSPELADAGGGADEPAEGGGDEPVAAELVGAGGTASGPAEEDGDRPAGAELADTDAGGSTSADESAGAELADAGGDEPVAAELVEAGDGAGGPAEDDRGESSAELAGVGGPAVEDDRDVESVTAELAAADRPAEGEGDVEPVTAGLAGAGGSAGGPAEGDRESVTAELAGAGGAGSDARADANRREPAGDAPAGDSSGELDQAVVDRSTVAASTGDQTASANVGKATARSEASIGAGAPEAHGAEGEELADPERLRAAVEAVLLVVDTPTTPTDLAQVLGRPVAEVADALRFLRAEYEAGGRGLDLREVAEGWRLYSREDFATYVERFILDGQQARLTQAALETLAVIAYRQPVTRSRIAGIRGVSVDAVMRTLLTRGLVEECGADPDTGGGLYRTTRLFLEKVGLRSLDELPSLAPLLPDTSQLDDVAVST